jgi:uncharacterized protein (DUF736 family)
MNSISIQGTVREVSINGEEQLRGPLLINGMPVNVAFTPVLDKSKYKSPDYKILGSKDEGYGAKLGAGWIKEDIDLLTGNPVSFISVTLDHFSFPKKIYFYLFKIDSETWEVRTRERQAA